MVGLLEFGPDVGPVIGAQVTAGHNTGGRTFNKNATLYWHRAKAAHPLAHSLRRHPTDVGQGALSTDCLRGLLDRGIWLHGSNTNIGFFSLNHCFI